VVFPFLYDFSWFKCAIVCCCAKLKNKTKCVAGCRDDGVVVQPCDCRLTTYKSIDEASSIWIKGREFSIETLLGPAYHPTWCNCQLVLSRLAPSDHHRFYMPCRGQLRQLTWIEGDFYSVKPVRSLHGSSRPALPTCMQHRQV
jgi:phosphatidylserine decarboxylase